MLVINVCTSVLTGSNGRCSTTEKCEYDHIWQMSAYIYYSLQKERLLKFLVSQYFFLKLKYFSVNLAFETSILSDFFRILFIEASLVLIQYTDGKKPYHLWDWSWTRCFLTRLYFYTNLHHTFPTTASCLHSLRTHMAWRAWFLLSGCSITLL